MKIRNFCLFLFCAVILFAPMGYPEVKNADKAGSWYPGTRSELSDMLEGYLAQAVPQEIKYRIIGIISPHAGYVYSGPVAAYGFKSLQDTGITTAIVIGFNHAFRHDGIAVCDYDSYKTPLGEIKIDKELSDALISQHEKIYPFKKAFYDEQSTEMQIPFIQAVLPQSSLVVLSIGDQNYAYCRILAEALYNVLKDRKNFVLIGSTDMCHFLSYDKNNKVDEFTIEVIKKMSPDILFTASASKGHQLMCGYGAVCATMMASKKLGADKVEILRHANSGDVSFDRRRVVGYLSAVMVDTKMSVNGIKLDEEKKEVNNPEDEMDSLLNAEQKSKMLQLARDTIEQYLKDGSRIEVKEDDPVLNREMGAFVTLHKNGQLRGCIGNMVGRGPFCKTVRDMAIQAATGDPRFRSVTLEEMKDIDIEISALSPMEKIDDPGTIEVGKHGVLVRQGFSSGVYLPQVATETGWDREQFMNSLCGQKAGMSPSAWKDGSCDIYVFTAEVFGEKE